MIGKKGMFFEVNDVGSIDNAVIIAGTEEEATLVQKSATSQVTPELKKLLEEWWTNTTSE